MMKLRIWTGQETLASINGAGLDTFAAFETWLAGQPDGCIEVWAGRWWQVSKEGLPFTLKQGRVYCAHPSYRGKLGLDPAGYSGFYAFEAWKRAEQVAGMWLSIPAMAADVTA